MALLEPIQARYRELIDDKPELTRMLRVGSDRARSVATKTLKRAYDAIGRSARAGHEATIRDCAEVLHGNLPAAVKAAVPFERAVWVVRVIREMPDPWVAVVEGTAELLGWKDYARVHAAYVISAVIQQG